MEPDPNKVSPLEEFRKSIQAVDVEKPDLDKYELAVAMLLANIYTLSREIVGRNLSDTADPMPLDKGCQEMIQCVHRFEQEVEREKLI